MHEADIQQALARIQEQLHTLTRHPERVKSPQQDADAQTLAAIRLVIDLLPEEIRQQMTEILALRDQLHSPYLQHATEMTSLHHASEHHSDLPRWIQHDTTQDRS
jgi:dsDNA-specific endonuclease/ATPase MutS2